MRCLSETELQRLISYVQEEADVARRRGATRAVVDEAIVLLLLNAGLRVNELCSLVMADIVIEQNRSTVSVRDSSGNVLRAVEITSETALCLRRFVDASLLRRCIALPPAARLQLPSRSDPSHGRPGIRPFARGSPRHATDRFRRCRSVQSRFACHLVG